MRELELLMRTLILLAAAFAAPQVSSHDRELPFRTHVIDDSAEYSACAAFDINGDGRLDITCGGAWYEAPAWQRHPIRDVERIRGRFDDYSHLPVDVNGDGRLDLVSANYRSGKLYWVEQPADLSQTWHTHLIAMPGPMETGRLVDVDGDGTLDVLPNGVRFAAWWELSRAQKGGGTPDKGAAATPFRWIRHDLPDEVAGHGVGFGDVNGDGRGDIVGPRGWLEAPADRRAGTWKWHQEFELTRASIPILVFDVDGDGDNDLVWARGHRFGIYWLEQVRGPASKRSWARHAIDTQVAQYHSLLLCDLDGDGRDEVVAGRRYLGHEGRDPGEYDPLAVFAYGFDRQRAVWRRWMISRGGIGGFGLDPKAVDLDGDGDLDLVGSGRSGVAWFENLRTQKSPAPSTADPPPTAPPPMYDDHTRLLVLHTSRGRERPVKTPFDWFERRTHIVRGAEQAMGPLPGPERRCPLDVKVLATARTPQYVRQTITYRAEPGDRVPAFLLLPEPRRGKHPAMLCLHQTTRGGKREPAGLGGKETLHYAHELAGRGYVCLVPDYPSFGDYRFDFRAARDRYASGTMKAIWNNVRGVDLLEGLPEVDIDRIGCIGHSLGGHNAIFTAVFDRRIRAVISSCGFTAFHRYKGGNLAGWASARYMPRIREHYGNDPDRVPFDFHELVAALAPRAFFASAPQEDGNFDVRGVREVMAAASRVYELVGAKKRWRAVYPDAGHEFPGAVREEAYRWLQEELGGPRGRLRSPEK